MKKPSKRLAALMDKEERTESKAEKLREVRNPLLEKQEAKKKSKKIVKKKGK